MKPEDSFPEIGDLLRSQKPQSPVPPPLEARILHALEQHTRPRPKRIWLWFALPPAFAAITILLASRPQPNQPGIAQSPEPPPVPAAAPDPVVSLVDSANPLLNETAALTRDAKRVSGFLIGFLPSVGTEGE